MVLVKLENTNLWPHPKRNFHQSNIRSNCSGNFELERKFGADATALVNKAIADQVPYPSVVYQLSEILFDLQYKNRKLSDMRTEAFRQAIVRAGTSDIPKMKGK